jgi:spore maturation protein CgeB
MADIRMIEGRMMEQRTPPLSIVILGLSITSSWGNGHATTYRGLVMELARRGHAVTFLERDVPWYARHRDLPQPPWGRTHLYHSLEELKDSFGPAIRTADFVMLGSFVPEGAAIGSWVMREAAGVTGFYDIDTPVTLARLARGVFDYITPRLIPRFDLYLSFTGGPVLSHIRHRYGAKRVLPLYCSVDPAAYRPDDQPCSWELGYMGTYSEGRQPKLERLLCEPARHLPEARFVVAGPQYPEDIIWPGNVERHDHLVPGEHRRFYTRQRFTLNLTRPEMVRCGWSPSVRLFEAASCAAPIISDSWPGIEEFFVPGGEILVAESAADCIRFLATLPDSERRRIGKAARERILKAHTAAHRAAELDLFVQQERDRKSAPHSRNPRQPESAALSPSVPLSSLASSLPSSPRSAVFLPLRAIAGSHPSKSGPREAQQPKAIAAEFASTASRPSKGS